MLARILWLWLVSSWLHNLCLDVMLYISYSLSYTLLTQSSILELSMSNWNKFHWRTELWLVGFILPSAQQHKRKVLRRWWDQEVGPRPLMLRYNWKIWNEEILNLQHYVKWGCIFLRFKYFYLREMKANFFSS